MVSRSETRRLRRCLDTAPISIFAMSRQHDFLFGEMRVGSSRPCARARPRPPRSRAGRHPERPPSRTRIARPARDGMRQTLFGQGLRSFFQNPPGSLGRDAVGVLQLDKLAAEQFKGPARADLHFFLTADFAFAPQHRSAETAIRCASRARRANPVCSQGAPSARTFGFPPVVGRRE